MQIEILEEELKKVFEANGKTFSLPKDETLLNASFGLDSLEWAEFAVRFQKRTGRDLFLESNEPLKTYLDLKKLVLK